MPVFCSKSVKSGELPERGADRSVDHGQPWLAYAVKKQPKIELPAYLTRRSIAEQYIRMIDSAAK